LIGEYDATGQLVQEIIWLGDLPVAVFKPAANSGATPDIYYIHADHLGTPRKITRPNDNKVMWSWESEAFGNSLPDQNPSGLGNFVFNLRFPGQYYDAETGLHYNMARYYNAQHGRYDQSDRIGLRGGINTYAYVGGNPVSNIDPTGQNFTLGAELGAEGGFAIGGPVGAVAGAIVGGAVGYVAADQFANWMASRSQGKGDEARPPDVNPGKDCDGKCKSCPPNPPSFDHQGDAHGTDRGFHTHQWQYNQAPDCTCRAQKVTW
ncbi:MAG: RHS repeat-associated core domain-containing protein, partial [Methylococcaceae bacterium]